MSQQPIKKPKISGFVRHQRPTTTVRVAHVRDVRLSSRGHAVEQKTRSIESRWHNWVVKDDEEFGLDGYDEDWELEGPSVLLAHEPSTMPGEKGKRKRSKTAVRYISSHPPLCLTNHIIRRDLALSGKRITVPVILTNY